jgi:hypothetical protein
MEGCCDPSNPYILAYGFLKIGGNFSGSFEFPKAMVHNQGIIFEFPYAGGKHPCSQGTDISWNYPLVYIVA